MPDKKQKDNKSKKKTTGGNQDRIDSVLDADSGSTSTSKSK